MYTIAVEVTLTHAIVSFHSFISPKMPPFAVRIWLAFFFVATVALFADRNVLSREMQIAVIANQNGSIR